MPIARCFSLLTSVGMWFGALMITAVGGSAAVANEKQPLFDGRTLAGWHTSGQAVWRAGNNEITGSAKRGGGWLTLDKAYQDFSLSFMFRCTGSCDMGVMFGIDRSQENWSGTHVALTEETPQVATSQFDGAGGLVVASALPNLPEGPSPYPPSPLAPAKTYPSPASHPINDEPEGAHYNPGNWNHVEIRVLGNLVEVYLNNRYVDLQKKGLAVLNPYAPIAIRLGNQTNGDVQFRDLNISDLTLSPWAGSLKLSPDFRMAQLSTMFNGYGEAVSDINRDGILDVVAGTTYYLGPDFTIAREIEDAEPMSPLGYKVGMTLGGFVSDFTGDGWPDVLLAQWPAGMPGYLYINPGKETRRWSRSMVLPNIDGELFSLDDIDGDGKLEFVYAADGAINAASPDLNNPGGPWLVKALTEPGPWGRRNAHGLGVGDVNGDGRLDILSAWGWFEQAADGATPWKLHPFAFGRSPKTGTPGGAQMYVYDVDGDGLNDIVTSLEAHGRGLAWFRQIKDENGAITFEINMIMDVDPALSHGVVFSELHSIALVDMDGDGLKDIVTGKNKTNVAHLNTAHYVDADAEGVIYWFKLVRKAGGGVEFIPHLINNRSGMGRQIQAADLNDDGIMDLVTSTRAGVFVFHGKAK